MSVIDIVLGKELTRSHVWGQQDGGKSRRAARTSEQMSPPGDKNLIYVIIEHGEQALMKSKKEDNKFFLCKWYVKIKVNECDRHESRTCGSNQQIKRLNQLSYLTLVTKTLLP